MGASTWLFWQSSLMTVLWPVVVVAQLACLVHVLKTGRPYWWLWIIFGFPVIGLAAYIYLEVRPTWGKVSWQTVLWNLKSRRERIASALRDLDRAVIDDRNSAARARRIDDDQKPPGAGRRAASRRAIRSRVSGARGRAARRFQGRRAFAHAVDRGPSGSGPRCRSRKIPHPSSAR